MGQGVPSYEVPGDVFPSVAVYFVEFEELFFFVVGPGFFVDGGVEVVVPAFAALFAGALGDVVDIFEFEGDLGPIVEAELGN